MSLDYHHCVMVGVNILSKANDIRYDDRYLPYIEGRQGLEFSIVDDYGERGFMYFGKVLAGGDEHGGIERTELEKETLEAAFQDVSRGYKEVFGEECDQRQIKLVALTVIW